MHIRVLLVHHHPIVRQGLRSILEREPDFDVIGEVASGMEAEKLVRFALPDVVIVDLQMAAPSGLETAKAIRAASPQVRIVFVGLEIAKEHVEEGTKAGGCGFVAYERAQTDLVRMIRLEL